MQRILSQGEHSMVYVNDNEPDIVIKENKQPKDDPGYVSRQHRGYEIINNINSHNHDTGVILPQLVDTIDTGDKQIIKEKIIHGVPFKPRIYFALSEEQKNNVAKQMATFLNAMHSSYECEPAQESIKNTFNGRLNNAEEIIAKFDGALPKSIADGLRHAEQYLLRSDLSDEVIVMTHGDLRIHNVMYDETTGKIAVIDFELAKIGNVYRDFVAHAPTSSMPWDFTVRVINFYNQISNKKYPIIIDKEKVQNMLIYGVMHEFARCVKPGDNDKANGKDFTEMYGILETVTGKNFDTKSVFEKATKSMHKTDFVPEQVNIPKR